ncbi:ABC transporter substrate-binding protein [Lederbergia panacisoli]|uniref:ABC transporter substrate-binding protein n=1 Tax=Lederbergia panacisoli TaxID=1255251 RepID=UPI00214BF404|nr:ABC transporter substrate-binding protein [Lederbergia panacisoli]MCR2822980.1 ABC transporter substrate-binding protein [Lederbergia panacisoli]
MRAENRSFSRLFVSISLILVMVVMSACSGSSNSGSNSDSNSGSNSSNGDSKEEVTLTWWVHQSPAFNEANKAMIEEFEEEHPNIKIKMEIFPWDAIIQKLRAAFASKNTPDVVQMFGSWVPEYSSNGHLLPVTNEDLINDVFDVALGFYKHEDKVYGIPRESSIEAGAMLVSKEMFANAGLDYPKTWEELKDAARKLTVKNGNNIAVRGFDFISRDSVNYQFLAMILQQGGEYWDGDNKVNFTSPEAVNAMTELVNLVKEDQVTDLNLLDVPGAETYMTFFKGESAMTIIGPWAIPAGAEELNVSDDKYDYVPLPSFDAANPAYFAAKSGWGEVVSSYTKHPDEAWTFVNFMAEKERSKQWNISTFTVPALKSVAHDANFQEEVPIMKTALEALEHGKTIGRMKDDSFWFKTVLDNFQAMVRGNVSVEDGLKQIENEINQMLQSK